MRWDIIYLICSKMQILKGSFWSNDKDCNGIFKNNVASSTLYILITSNFTILAISLLYGHFSKNGQGGSEFAFPHCIYVG